MNAEIIQALDVLLKEKNIDKDEMIAAIEESITSSYKKNYGSGQDVKSVFDLMTGEINVYVEYLVVNEVMDGEKEISVEEAQEYDPNLQAGDICKIMVTPKDFGRIAAQNAKQLIIQKIKEAERNMIYANLEARQGEVVNAVITRIDRDIVFMDIGNYEAALMPSEQISGEDYEVGKRYKVLMLSVRHSKMGPQVTVSRTHPNLVRRLFENEVPEIYNGNVVIYGIAREAGSRTKIAVKSTVEGLEAVGTCVGQRGVRVHQIIKDLGGEKIDVVNHSDDHAIFISNALSPAKVMKILPSTKDKMVLAVVDNHQFSLAIGKEGQNVRLAAKLTGCKIDIKNQTEYERLLVENPEFFIPFGIYPEGYEPEEAEQTIGDDTNTSEEALTVQEVLLAEEDESKEEIAEDVPAYAIVDVVDVEETSKEIDS